MPCSFPIHAYYRGDGSVGIHKAGAKRGSDPLLLPCGRCARCRLEHSRQWAVRCMHELQLHNLNTFANLTIDDEHFKPSLDHKDFQLFMKRLRHARAPAKLSYYMSGEYGERFHRPHYHAILFGCAFPDQIYYGKSPSGHELYTSKELDELWQLGQCKIGQVTFESAAYVARYVMKKMNGEKAESHYKRVDPETGEEIQVTPEYSRMSLNPAIGKRWIEQYHPEVYPNDQVISRGHPAKPPRYYDLYLKRTQPELHEEVTLRRKAEASTRSEDNTPERLAVKEAVAIAGTKLKQRKME